ncbi:MAG: invasin domain 3-containing protein [bacterium]|nr:invasin domain 3-containing protein [bacterium]
MSVHRSSRKTLQKAALGALILLAGLFCSQQNPLDPTGSLGGKLSLLVNMTASPNRVRTGGVKSQILVRLMDENSQPIANGTVTFQTSMGTLTPASAVTSSTGWVSTELTSGTTAGSATVTARYGQAASSTVTVEFVSGATDTSGVILLMEADQNEILANGISTSKLNLQLVTRGSESLSASEIALTSTAGTLPASVFTDSDGKAETVLTSVASPVDVMATVRAVYGSQEVTVNVLFKGVRFDLEAAPQALFADGASVASVRAVLKESTTGIGLPNEPVRFGSTLGTIQAQALTDLSGTATVQLTSGTATGTAVIVARYGRTLLDTVRVAFQTPSYSVETAATPKAILADGLDKSTIRVTVKDENGRAIAGQAVYFATTAGDIDYVSTTNNLGVTEATLVGTASAVDQTATVTVTVKGISKTLPVQFKGVQFEVTADPRYLTADGVSQSRVTAYVRETTSRIGIGDAVVQFGSNLGTIPGTVQTDVQGVAAALLTSSTVQGTARVVARFGNVFLDTVNVQFGSQTASGIQQIAASPGYILANGQDQAFVSVKVVDAGNRPVAGASVNFTASSGVIQTQDETDAMGVATVPLTSSESTTDVVSTVTATYGQQTLSTQVVFEGVQMTVSASPLAILADGRSTSTVRVVMKRTTSKIAITGAALRFATDLGTIPASASTNSEGVAQVNLTSSTSVGTARVTVLYGATLSGQASVNFQASIPTYLQVSATPPVLPADGKSQSEIRAIISDANRNPVPDGTLVQFELARGSGSMDRQKTTVNGVASTLLTAGTRPDNAWVRVTSGALRDSILVVYTVGQPYQVLINASPTRIAADGIEISNISARVLDEQGNPVTGVNVFFTATIGDITPNAPTDGQGMAYGQFSSGIVGTATVTASVSLSGNKTLSSNVVIQATAGGSNSIQLRFDPVWIGVRDTGQNQTMTVYADIKDAKNNPVDDGTLVQFAFVGSPLGCAFSTTRSIPTVGGTAQISVTSGTQAGSIRIKATVVNGAGVPVTPAISATSTYLLVHAGPPYIENINDLTTTHLTVRATRLNIWSALDTTQVSILVGDKYNNPVERNTAVYLTVSGGVISTHTAYTNEFGKATVVLTGGNPQPTIDRFYNYPGMQDPNTRAVLPGFMWFESLGQWLIPNFDAYPESAVGGESYPGIAAGRILNTEGNTLQNDGIARVMASTEGVDAAGRSAIVWDQTAVAMTGPVFFEDNSMQVIAERGDNILYDGESATIRITLMDGNGNPVVSGTQILAALTSETAQAKLSWTEFNTGNGMGQSYYYITISSALNPEKPKGGITGIRINWNNTFYRGWAAVAGQFLIDINRRP